MAYWSDTEEQFVDYDPLVINGLPWYWWRPELVAEREARFGKPETSPGEPRAQRQLSRTGYFQEPKKEVLEQTRQSRVLNGKNGNNGKQVEDSHKVTDWRTRHREIMEALREIGYAMGVDIDKVSEKPSMVEDDGCDETQAGSGIDNLSIKPDEAPTQPSMVEDDGCNGTQVGFVTCNPWSELDEVPRKCPTFQEQFDEVNHVTYSSPRSEIPHFLEFKSCARVVQNEKHSLNNSVQEHSLNNRVQEENFSEFGGESQVGLAENMVLACGVNADEIGSKFMDDRSFMVKDLVLVDVNAQVTHPDVPHVDLKVKKRSQRTCVEYFGTHKLEFVGLGDHVEYVLVDAVVESIGSLEGIVRKTEGGVHRKRTVEMVFLSWLNKVFEDQKIGVLKMATSKIIQLKFWEFWPRWRSREGFDCSFVLNTLKGDDWKSALLRTFEATIGDGTESYPQLGKCGVKTFLTWSCTLLNGDDMVECSVCLENQIVGEENNEIEMLLKSYFEVLLRKCRVRLNDVDGVAEITLMGDLQFSVFLAVLEGILGGRGKRATAIESVCWMKNKVLEPEPEPEPEAMNELVFDNFRIKFSVFLQQILADYACVQTCLTIAADISSAASLQQLHLQNLGQSSLDGLGEATGANKGVILTHKNLISMVALMVEDANCHFRVGIEQVCGDLYVAKMAEVPAPVHKELVLDNFNIKFATILDQLLEEYHGLHLPAACLQFLAGVGTVFRLVAVIAALLATTDVYWLIWFVQKEASHLVQFCNVAEQHN